jgi:hypothetical protein
VKGVVIVESPEPGSGVAAGHVIQGRSTSPGQVYLWVEGVNFAIPVQMHGDSWSYIYAGGILGHRALVLSVVNEGVWGQPTRVEYLFVAPEGVLPVDSGDGASRVTDSWPTPLRVVFRPVEQVLQAAVAIVTGGAGSVAGRGSGDLDGNGIPDRWQGGPVAPNHGFVGRVPYLNVGLVVLGVVAIVGGVYVARSTQLNALIVRRQEIKLREKQLRAQVEQKKLGVVSKLKQRQWGLVGSLKSKQLGVGEKLQLQQLQFASKSDIERVRVARHLQGKMIDLQKKRLEKVPALGGSQMAAAGGKKMSFGDRWRAFRGKDEERM